MSDGVFTVYSSTLIDLIALNLQEDLPEQEQVKIFETSSILGISPDSQTTCFPAKREARDQVLCYFLGIPGPK